MAKTAFITGITGQDGAYLARFLLQKGYIVHGLHRRSSSPNTSRLASVLNPPQLTLHEGDMLDSESLARLIERIKPDEIYNLAAQSHVHTSFEMPVYTGDVTGLGVLRILDAIRRCGLEKTTRFYQASTSELFGNSSVAKQSETTPFTPRSPYAIAKLFAHWSTICHREAYGMFACCGILFNHESPLRGEMFITRKVTIAAAKIANGHQEKLRVGNMNSKRDWGHASDYVEGMWMMLQQDAPDDYVLATGETRTVREFIDCAFEEAGIPLSWKGTGIDEKGIDAKSGKVFVEVDPQFFRPNEVDFLCGDPGKAEKMLNWKRNFSFDDLVRDMVKYDMAEWAK